MKEDAIAWRASGPAPNQARVDGAGDRIRLILVDDDDDFREAATGELTDLGFAVESFADGQTAWHRHRSASGSRQRAYRHRNPADGHIENRRPIYLW